MNTPDEFNLTMTGDSMSPRFQDGEVLILSRARKVSCGCHAAVSLKDGRGLIGIVERHGLDGIRLRQCNPAIIHHLSAIDIVSAYRIVGTREQQTS